jgi:hypothetical protein
VGGRSGRAVWLGAKVPGGRLDATITGRLQEAVRRTSTKPCSLRPTVIDQVARRVTALTTSFFALAALLLFMLFVPVYPFLTFLVAALTHNPGYGE